MWNVGKIDKCSLTMSPSPMLNTMLPFMMFSWIQFPCHDVPFYNKRCSLIWCYRLPSFIRGKNISPRRRELMREKSFFVKKCWNKFFVADRFHIDFDTVVPRYMSKKISIIIYFDFIFQFSMNTAKSSQIKEFSLSFILP